MILFKQKRLLSAIELILLIAVFSFLFLYRLGFASLQSYDEAWYASISRNIIEKNNFFILKYNDQIYLDHPPAGF